MCWPSLSTANAPDLPPENLALLDALASLIAVALERLHYVDVAQESQVTWSSERLRSSILSALSHDLRTPLTALVGLGRLACSWSSRPCRRRHSKPRRPCANRPHGWPALVGNLLDMARLNAGKVILRREWQPLEEVIGASIKLLGNALADHPVHVRCRPDCRCWNSMRY